MKTAVSVPDEIFHKVERLAKRSGRSRSELYSAALREYVNQHAADEITETLDRVIEQASKPVDPFVDAAGKATLKRSEW